MLEMLKVIPPIFILLGILDVWVKKEKIIKYMEKGSGIKGMFLSFIIGSTVTGPLYAAFPVAGVLLSTMKIPLLIFESTSLGIEFAMIRLGLNIIAILTIASIINNILKNEEKEKIYNLADKIEK